MSNIDQIYDSYFRSRQQSESFSLRYELHMVKPDKVNKKEKQERNEKDEKTHSSKCVCDCLSVQNGKRIVVAITQTTIDFLEDGGVWRAKEKYALLHKTSQNNIVEQVRQIEY